MTSEEEEIFCDVESSVQGSSGNKEESDDDAPPPNIKTPNLFSALKKSVTFCKKRIIDNENEASITFLDGGNG